MWHFSIIGKLQKGKIKYLPTKRMNRFTLVSCSFFLLQKYTKFTNNSYKENLKLENYVNVIYNIDVTDKGCFWRKTV